jgi:hypothetical protein
LWKICDVARRIAHLLGAEDSFQALQLRQPPALGTYPVSGGQLFQRRVQAMEVVNVRARLTAKQWVIHLPAFLALAIVLHDTTQVTPLKSIFFYSFLTQIHKESTS